MDLLISVRLSTIDMHRHEIMVRKTFIGLPSTKTRLLPNIISTGVPRNSLATRSNLTISEQHGIILQRKLHSIQSPQQITVKQTITTAQLTWWYLCWYVPRARTSERQRSTIRSLECICRPSTYIAKIQIRQ